MKLLQITSNTLNHNKKNTHPPNQINSLKIQNRNLQTCNKLNLIYSQQSLKFGKKKHLFKFQIKSSSRNHKLIYLTISAIQINEINI